MPQNNALTVQVKLPAVTDITASIVEQLTDALGVPRDILASDDDINQAWRELSMAVGRCRHSKRNAALCAVSSEVCTPVSE